MRPRFGPWQSTWIRRLVPVVGMALAQLTDRISGGLARTFYLVFQKYSSYVSIRRILHSSLLTVSSVGHPTLSVASVKHSYL